MNQIHSVVFTLFITATLAWGGTVSESQRKYLPKGKFNNQVLPEEALINTDPEPDLDDFGFVSLYEGKDLSGWVVRGGTCTFDPQGKKIVGKVIAGSPNTFLSTAREDYRDFVFTTEVYWEVNSNSGIMIRARRKEGDTHEVVYGPQVELEGAGKRAWSGGIYGEKAGGWHYPMWLEAHKPAREALNLEGWNRITVQAKGKTIKTWINGVPAAHWETKEYREGFIGLQLHAGKRGEIHFRNIKIMELK